MKDLPLIEVEEIETKPRNQWHEQLLKQADQMPTSQKHWDNSKPTITNRDCIVYEWP